MGRAEGFFAARGVDSGGVEEEEVPGAGPREERVGLDPGGALVEVGNRGDGVAVLEDESGGG